MPTCRAGQLQCLVRCSTGIRDSDPAQRLCYASQTTPASAPGAGSHQAGSKTHKPLLLGHRPGYGPETASAALTDRPGSGAALVC
jgi:hypothetical protein